MVKNIRVGYITLLAGRCTTKLRVPAVAANFSHAQTGMKLGGQTPDIPENVFLFADYTPVFFADGSFVLQQL